MKFFKYFASFPPCMFIFSCMFINFSFDFLAVRLLSPVRLLILALQSPPVRLLSPVRLFGTRE